MYRFNLNNVSKHNLEIVEEYLNKNSFIWIDQIFQDFTNNSEENIKLDYFTDDIEISILFNEIFEKNKDLVSKLSTDYQNNFKMKSILSTSIEEEKTKRFKRKLEDILNKSDKRLNKDLNLIDKKMKI